VKWSVFFKEAFINFSNFEGAWTSLRAPLPNNDIGVKRREYFLGHQKKKPSLQGERQRIYKSNFFMSQLPNSPYQEGTDIDGEEEVDYSANVRFRKRRTGGVQTARVDAGASADFPFDLNFSAEPEVLQQQGQQIALQDYGTHIARQRVIRQSAANARKISSHKSILLPYQSDEYDIVYGNQTPKSKMETKQYLPHLLSTELLINTRLHGDFTCSRSEFCSWSPSLPHSTITSALTFFGLSQKWLSSFTTFLEAPLKFTEDGPSAKTRPRKRGVPGAHALSAVCGETILFCMDYAVNQATNGTNLYRMSDDFWVWDKNHETVVKAWTAITKFADTMGVSLNNGKTGTVRILSEPQSSYPSDPFDVSNSSSQEQKSPAPIDPSLPAGENRWGFLVMDPLTGQFVLDQDMVSNHVKELQTQLSTKSSSIFSYIQA
jgi:hypothetical protein